MPIVFANPWMLLALAAAAVPAIIHLISRQRARKLPISTLRFLLQTDRRTARKHKLVDLLVLLLRTGLVLCLALALSKPYLQPRRAAGDMVPGQTAWAIVLDDSLSMGLVHEGLTIFDQAIAAAADLLKSIPDSDEIMLLLTSGRRRERLNVPTYRSSAVIEALRRLEAPSCSDASIASALEQGLIFLEASTHLNRALVVISDFQESALRDAMESLRTSKEPSKPVSHFWLDVGRPAEGNVAIQSARVSQAMPFAGLPMRVRAVVVNYGDKGVRQTVSFWTGSSKLESREIEVAADSVSEVEFHHVPIEPGNFAGEVRLEGDSLPADNRRFFSWHVTGRVRVVVIHGGPTDQQRWDDVFFLRSVLEPVTEDPKAGRMRGLQVDYVNESAAAKITWPDYQIALVVGLDRLPEGLGPKIEDFARRGGGVIVFAGGDSGTTQPASADAPDATLLGLAASDIRSETAEGDRTLTLGPVDEQHPIFRTLTRTATANLSVIEFYTYRRVSAAGLRGDSRVLASLDSGDPFLVERRIGDGRVLAFLTRCHPDWSNLPVRPLFLPLIYETMKYCVLAQLGLQSDLAPMATLRYKLPEGATFTHAVVEDPDKASHSYPLGPGKTELIVERLEKPGIYNLYFQAGEVETKAIVPVNVNADEGRIVRLDADEVAEKLTAVKARVYRSPSALVAALHRQRQGVGLAGFFLYLAALCFLAESFLANYLIPREQAALGAPKTTAST